MTTSSPAENLKYVYDEEAPPDSFAVSSEIEPPAQTAERILVVNENVRTPEIPVIAPEYIYESPEIEPPAQTAERIPVANEGVLTSEEKQLIEKIEQQTIDILPKLQDLVLMLENSEAKSGMTQDTIIGLSTIPALIGMFGGIVMALKFIGQGEFALIAGALGGWATGFTLPFKVSTAWISEESYAKNRLKKLEDASNAMDEIEKKYDESRAVFKSALINNRAVMVTKNFRLRSGEVSELTYLEATPDQKTAMHAEM